MILELFFLKDSQSYMTLPNYIYEAWQKELLPHYPCRTHNTKWVSILYYLFNNYLRTISSTYKKGSYNQVQIFF